jgi:protein-S-isoprenylcysteine O-methyltransferase Ste14
MKRILAWSEMLVLFVLLYAGIPWAGLAIDGFLKIPPWPPPVRWIGPVLLVVGLAGLAWSFALFVRVGGGTPNPSMPPTALVMVGPYRWTRNPIALSHAAALFGLSLLLGSVSAAAIVVVLAIPVHVAMVHEEKTLEARFGDSYRAYKASVPRWIPRLRKRQS